ncbi:MULTISPECIES: hypothetical protein [Enterobacter]|uniref:hypothetical protein n=1 Tax=Enterobacter TaxID=547 RepID=UPI0012D2E526|nr:hypothetical protein [Enterobacter pseudoroggenkampii]MCK4227694.1 hypothetical protein [Enterobacter asburiae]MCX8288360.1 hypothetical protein [Enterobacter pseudoroggenkampii]
MSEASDYDLTALAGRIQRTGKSIQFEWENIRNEVHIVSDVKKSGFSGAEPGLSLTGRIVQLFLNDRHYFTCAGRFLLQWHK